MSASSGLLLHFRTVLRNLAGRKLHLGSLSKYVALLILLANVTSLPFAWHIYVFWPLVKLRVRMLASRARMLVTLRSRVDKEAEAVRMLVNILPVGRSPFDFVTKYNSWVGIDDADFNLHLSNSCYPKVCDAARLKAALEIFPAAFRAGAKLALGATHFIFLREIPIFSRYEVRISVAAWDDKWIYVIARFITYPNKSNSKSIHRSTTSLDADNSQSTLLATDANLLRNTLRIPESGDLSGASTPERRDVALAEVTGGLDEGATLNCLAVCRVVFKHGRITVPPALALALNGFSRGQALSGSEDGRVRAFSHTTPPPHWPEALSLLGGSTADAARFLRGGWRDVPESARWWDDAMGAEVEVRRSINLARMRGLREGMDGAVQCCQLLY